jgi:hypothetical protein
VTKGYRGQTCAEAIKNCFSNRDTLSASALFQMVRAQGDWTEETIWQHSMSFVVNLPPARHHWRQIRSPFLFLRPDGQYEIYKKGTHPQVVD